MVLAFFTQDSYAQFLLLHQKKCRQAMCEAALQLIALSTFISYCEDTK